MPRKYREHATQYDIRDLDIMFKIAENNGSGATAVDLADVLGFRPEEGAKNIGIRLAWMQRYGMVVFDDRDRTWGLSKSGRRITGAHLRAPELRVIEEMPDEKMVETMGLVLSRFQRGDSTLGHMLKREFNYTTHQKNR